jgi:uncharacterized protein
MSRAGGVSGALSEELWQKTFASIEQRCARGEANACWDAVQATQDSYGGAEADDKRLREMRRRACDAGSAHGCLMLAEDYASGAEDTRDAAAEHKYREKACDLGDAEACSQLGQSATDTKLALEFDKRTCELGNTGGCLRAVEILEGRPPWNLPRDPAGVTAMWKRACGLGLADGCLAAASDAELAKDDDLALHLYTRACMLNDTVHGCAGELELLDGKCKGGDADSCQLYKFVLGDLPPHRRDLALFACCYDPKQPPSTPTAAVLLMAEALRREDRASIETLIHPRKGLSVRLQPAGGRPKTFKLKAHKFDFSKIANAMVIDMDQMKCGPVIGKEASCTPPNADMVATYKVRVEKNRAYVVSIDEKAR